jgi:hypothetical protein
MSYEITREDMIEPIQRMFEREYGDDYGLFEIVEEESGGERLVDLVYIHGDSEHLHVVRLEGSYDNCVFDVQDGGLHVLRDVEANYRWIALPLYEFREGEDEHSGAMKDGCENRGIGVISAQKKGRGVSAKILLEPEHQEGEFLDHYPSARDEWEAYTRQETAPEGYKVVEYYER